jgi:hypothetical protein
MATTPDSVKTFLSCSIRAGDRPLVGAIAQYVLEPMGFECVTVGRNVSGPDQPDDIVRKYMSECDCLIGIATKRLVGADDAFPDRTLVLATPYLLQETAMAHQEEMPFLIFKAPAVTLQGVTTRNLYIEVRPDLSPRGRPIFVAGRELLASSVRDLKARALARRTKRKSADLLQLGLKGLGALAVGGIIVKGADLLSRPSCFGGFYYRDAECKDCSFRAKCKAEKALKGG